MTRYVFEHLDKHFGERRILTDVSITLTGGECLLLCGNNGVGKSTLLRILAGMERPHACSVDSGTGATHWRKARRQLLRDVIYMHQQPYLFEGTVAFNLNYPLRGSRVQREQRVDEALEWSGLGELARQPVYQLSGGERQRVALARAWLRQPRVMLLDEPTTNMDMTCRRRTVDLLQSLKNDGVALAVATHDTQHFHELSDCVLRLEAGRLGALLPAADELPDKVTPIGARKRGTA